jgi:N-acetylneuraminate synthase
VELCGSSSETRKLPIGKETAYLDTYIRGVYAKRDLKPGELLTEDDIYMAIPLQKGQISCKELMLGKYGHRIIAECKNDAPLSLHHIDAPYSRDSKLRELINKRGI